MCKVLESDPLRISCYDISFMSKPNYDIEKKILGKNYPEAHYPPPNTTCKHTPRVRSDWSGQFCSVCKSNEYFNFSRNIFIFNCTIKT